MPQLQKIPHDVLEIVKEVVEERIPFNKLISMKVEAFNHDSFCLKIDMREELVGNFVQGILHGGVIAATLDVVGGFTAFLSVISQMEGSTPAEKMQRFSRTGTIDLRIDYLRPGRGKHFIATGYVLRTGSKVSVTRMELHNDEDILID
ncbi:MAG: hypothetical protein COB67_13145 [SAR324 cluster bacterium]|uniref:Thioesterase domain-containing protein n=1 Tax=SAR324 cluster bacterium TaxID=2024889 RepID=A0A2A4SPI5_9DELT|nr:MAG: hypothetical protein COB67_13145 [SAR324 cluster bacterium]